MSRRPPTDAEREAFRSGFLVCLLLVILLVTLNEGYECFLGSNPLAECGW